MVLLYTALVLWNELKPKLFAVLLSIDIVVSVRRALDGLGFGHFSKVKKSKHHSYSSVSLA